MTTTLPSNSYADKVYSEHPIALWSLDEEFGEGSLGYNISNIANLGTIYCYPAGAYGVSDNHGYYIGESDSTYYVESGGIPMVYGASNLSEIYPNNSGIDPSIIIPGMGFLNHAGQAKTLTLEFWLKIYADYAVNPESVNLPFRFFGPVASNDGLYISNQSMILKIGNNITSHFVGEWNRPMLIQIQLSLNGAILSVNGDVVGQINYNALAQNFPLEFDSDGNEQNWLGFYSHEKARPNIDCVSIFPYLVPLAVAKKRYAYGQAVEFPQTVLAKNGGQSFNADSAVVDYSANYIYPNTSSWTRGVFRNLESFGSFLKYPNYQLPDFTCKKTSGGLTNTIDTNIWSKYTKDVLPSAMNDKSAVSFNLSLGGESYNTYARFNSMPMNNVRASIAYINFGINDDSRISSDSSERIIFKIIDKMTGKFYSLSSIYDGTTLSILEKTSEDSDPISSSDFEIYTNTEKIFFGIDFSMLALAYTNSIFKDNNQENWIIYLGGTENSLSGFEGEIYSFGFIDSNILALSSDLTYDNDISYKLDSDSYAGLKPTYELFFNTVGDLLYPDIRITGYWQDHIPFTVLSERNDNNGNYQFDFLQFNSNIDKIVTDITNGELSTQFPVKSYARITDSSTSNNERWWIGTSPTPLQANLVIQPEGSEVFEIADSYNIIPPTAVSHVNQSLFKTQYLDIAIEISVYGILAQPAVIKNLQIASYTQDSKKINSRLGVDLYPYQPDNQINTFITYKDSTPYNYLTDKSGVKLTGDFDSENIGNRGLKIKVNETSSSDFYVGVIQFNINFNEYSSLVSDTPILEIISQTAEYAHLRLYIKEIDSDVVGMRTLLLYAKTVDNSGSESYLLNTSNIDFYLDGHKITETTDLDGNTILNSIIEVSEWSTVGMLFNSPLLMDGDAEKYGIRIIGPGLYNNISYLRIPPSKVINASKFKTWTTTKNTGNWSTADSELWSYEKYDTYPTVLTRTPDYLFNLYSGTNRIIIDSSVGSVPFSWAERSEDGELWSDIKVYHWNNVKKVANSIIGFTSDEYAFYKNTSWLNKTIKPV